MNFSFFLLLFLLYYIVCVAFNYVCTTILTLMPFSLDIRKYEDPNHIPQNRVNIVCYHKSDALTRNKNDLTMIMNYLQNNDSNDN